jgi:regulator of protease activity HflC (stomatin/prohibitin superfamily)
MEGNNMARAIKRDPTTEPLDSDFKRDRASRYIVFALFVTGVPLLFILIGLIIAVVFFDGIAILGVIFGFGAGALVTAANVEKLFIIRNSTTGLFVTQNILRSFLGKDEVNVVYGPGVHICFPWERRLKGNGIALEEAAQDFTFKVQCSDGLLTVNGSYRLRPDPRRPVPFLTGVAAIAEEMDGLIITKAVAELKTKKVKSAMRNIAKLTDILKHEFVGSKVKPETPIEKRFGIIISDVTIEQMLPSEELQRTMSALSEANAIAEGTAILLGMTRKAASLKLEADSTFRTQYNEARDRFLSVSGNLEGMDISRTEFMLRLDGIDPELVKAIGDIAKNPNLVAAAAAFGSKGGGSNQSKRSRRPNKGSQSKPQGTNP